MALYKYLAPPRIDVLERCAIRFTQPAAFNDPFEFRPSIEPAASQLRFRDYVEQNFDELLKRELKEYPILSQLPPERVIQMLRPMRERIPELFQLLELECLPRVALAIDASFNEHVGVLCLSEVRDSLLMWGHYTENHEGFVIGFDQDHSFFSIRRGPEDEFGFLRKVRYTRTRPKVTLADTTGTEWFETKCEEWAYEREWRMLRVLRDAEKRIDAAPHPICLFDFPADAVAEIIIGVRTSRELRDRLTSLSTKFSNAKIFHAKEDMYTYGLVIDRVV